MDKEALESLRNDYSDLGIDVSSVDSDPMRQFSIWFDEAVASGIAEPNGMVIATIDPEYGTSQRTVLMKSFDASGFLFYTNYESRKARQIDDHPVVSCLFPWLELHRQVSFQGTVKRATTEQSEKYFQSRPRDSQIGAWASRQSQLMPDRLELESKVAKIESRFEGQEIPLPEFWGGYQFHPTRIEFWQGRNSRLHDRLVYTHGNDPEQPWRLERLYP